ncbi:hypothetical protein H0I29_04330 [Polaribacter sp. R2A056_3_33]|jgi:hypothetical protein|uniref:hypothetical protein n=1 Tax=unclassified Polaribacter TaxID=196858 RepID=UPI001C4E9351|nr:hypothetical protein [Polaribacter sp. R2A056_3_33]QXP71316.1 hypothetical protein H0I29_04330 [Polaribacter sp. R2A056_3_33]
MDIITFFDNVEWCKFWESQLISLPLFLLGLILSIWLIPKITISRIKVVNKVYNRRKINFIVASLCGILNRVAQDYKVIGPGLDIYSKTNDKEINDFVAILRPNILTSPTKKVFDVNFLSKLIESDPEIVFTTLSKEINRLDDFLIRLEKVVGFHSLHLEEKIIQEIGILCLDIIDLKKTFEDNCIWDELKTKRTYVTGGREMLHVYKRIIELLGLVIKEKHLVIENTNINTV